MSGARDPNMHSRMYNSKEQEQKLRVQNLNHIFCGLELTSLPNFHPLLHCFSANLSYNYSYIFYHWQHGSKTNPIVWVSNLLLRWQMFSLWLRLPQLHQRVFVQCTAPIPDASFLLLQALSGSHDISSECIHAHCVGNLDWLPGFCHWSCYLQSKLADGNIQFARTLFVSLFQINSC